MKIILSFLLIVSLSACASNVEKIIAETKNNIKVANIYAISETTPVASGGDAADDPVIWVHPENTELSRILGTDKRWGLEVYDLQGIRVQGLEVGRVNNVDLRKDVLGGMDIAVASNRTANTLTLFTIDGDGKVSHIGDHSLNMPEPYGSCMYKDQLGNAHVFVNDKNGLYEQWQITSVAPIELELVRSWQVPSQPEGCVVNDATGILYFGEEAIGVWQLDLNSLDSQPRLLTTVDDGALVADVEGMDIYHGDTKSYLIASSQGDFSYAVYELADSLLYRGSFRVIANESTGIDGAQETDGLAVTNADLGGAFGNGMLVVQDGFNKKPGEAQNFKYVNWDSIARALSL